MATKNVYYISITFLLFLLVAALIFYKLAHSNNNLNTKTRYITIIDAGSSGSRLFIYKISPPSREFKNQNIPIITEIKIPDNKVEPGISKFANNITDLEQYINPLLNKANSFFKKAKIRTKSKVDFYILGTAGMRLLHNPEQNNIYQNLNNIVSKSNKFNQIITKTIPGDYEGLFDWLSVNYYEKNLQFNKPTAATLDMGGASTQVAFATHTYTDLDNTFEIEFGNARYTIVSKSFLGLGLDEFRKTFTGNIRNNENICNPNPNFDFKLCKKDIKKELNNSLKKDNPSAYLSYPIESNMKLIGISGYYYKFKFFTIDKISEIPKKISNKCMSNLDDFIDNNKNKDQVKYLLSHCFDTAYIDTLLVHKYKIPKLYKNFEVASQDVSWTLGAALLFATQTDSN